MHLSLRLFHESVHQQFLFKSCNALKKTNEWAQLTSEFFDALQLMNKNQLSTSHGMMFLFHTCWDFPSWQTHFRDWKQMTVKIYHSYRDTNDRTSMWKFQYVQYEIKWWFWRHTCTCSCKLWPLRATIIYIHLHVISPNSITPESNITVMRIKEMITNWRDSWFSDTGPSQYQRKCIEKWCWGIKDYSK